MSFQNTSIAHRLHMNELHYTHIDQLLDDRSGVECFRQFLHSYDQLGLVKLELWLTLRGYQREYERRQSDMAPVDFVKWNARCARALANKYWSTQSDEDITIRQLIGRLRKNQLNLEYLRQCFEQKSGQVRQELEENQFFRFNQVPRQLPVEPSCAASFVDSDAVSMCSNKAKSRRRHMEKNTGSDMAHVPPRRTINYHETEVATNHPTVFATRLIAKLEKLLLSEENHDQDDFGSKVDSWLMNVSSSHAKKEKPKIIKIDPNNNYRTHRHVLSSDSGLSSIVNQSSEPKDSDSEYSELNGLKKLLIQDIEPNYTKIIYAFQEEKFVIRVNSTAPTLFDFKAKFHDQKTKSTADLKFLFKQNSVWCEINDDLRYLPVYQHVVEAKVFLN